MIMALPEMQEWIEAAKAEPDELDHGVDPARRHVLGVGHPQQVVPGGAAGLEGGGVDQRPDMVQGVAQVLVGLATDQSGPLVGRIEAEDHSDGGGFPGPVRADETGHPARDHGEGHAVEGQRRPESFAQADDFDRCVAHSGRPSSSRWRFEGGCTTWQVSARCQWLTPC